MAYPSNDSDSVAHDQLRAFVERIERLEEEQKSINDDKSEVYKEAKGTGFDTKVLRKVIADRRKDSSARLEFEVIYDLYTAALGMQRGGGDQVADEVGTLDATRARTKSTAARNDVLGTEGKEPVSGSPDRTLAELEVAPRAGDQAEPGAGAAAPPVDTISETHDGEPSETLGTAAEPTGEVANDASSVPARMTAADNARSIRPWCLHADDLSKCAGQGRKHCHGCLKAHADAEGLSA